MIAQQNLTQNIVLASVMIPEIVGYTEPVMAIEVLVEPQWTCEICDISVKASSKSKHMKTKKHTQKETQKMTKPTTKPVIPVKPIEYTVTQPKPVAPPKPSKPSTPVHPTLQTLDATQREQVIRETLARYNIFVKDEEGIKELVALERWKNLNPETYRKYVDLLFTNYPWFPRIETFEVEYSNGSFLNITDEGYNYLRQFDDCFEEVEQLAQNNPNRAQERRQILDQVLEKAGFFIHSSKEEILFFQEWKDADAPTFEKYMKRMFEHSELPKVLDRVVINDKNELEYWYTKPNGKLKHKCEKIDYVYNDMIWGE